LAGLTALLFCILSAYRLPDAGDILTRASLAQLPESLKNLEVEIRRARVDGRPVFNQAWLFVRFQADPNDIACFIAESPGINKSQTRALSTASCSEEDPVWWSVDRSAAGWMYGIPDQGDVCAGNVIVNEDSNMVHLFVWIISHRQIREAKNSLDNLYNEIEDRVEDLLR
jgi:hypothetical protein